MPFPASFRWGVSAAAYQIEGAAEADGKSDSVWDVFCRQPGRIHEGHSGAVACDHYHRFEEDIALLREIGIPHYRLSLSWPRLLPDGIGKHNQAGFDFYHRLIDGLLEAGIQPWIMLYHWDMPQELFRRGGWMNREVVNWFGEYATSAAEAFSDRVRHWMTIEEPACFIELGYLHGRHAPGLQIQRGEAYRCAHHALLAHGTACQALRSHAQSDIEVGAAINGRTYIPASDSPADHAAAETMSMDSFLGMQSFSFWGDPMLLGHYQPGVLEELGEDAPPVSDDDLRLIHQPVDWLGFNYYHARFCQVGEAGPEYVPSHYGYDQTIQNGFAIRPEGLYYSCAYLYRRYQTPVLIAENGYQAHDVVAHDGRVYDQHRSDYILKHCLQVERAIDEGIPVIGYLLWSFMDNFEWALGYPIRLGLIHVNYETLERTPKASAGFYRELIASNGAILHRDDALTIQ